MDKINYSYDNNGVKTVKEKKIIPITKPQVYSNTAFGTDLDRILHEGSNSRKIREKDVLPDSRSNIYSKNELSDNDNINYKRSRDIFSRAFSEYPTDSDFDSSTRTNLYGSRPNFDNQRSQKYLRGEERNSYKDIKGSDFVPSYSVVKAQNYQPLPIPIKTEDYRPFPTQAIKEEYKPFPTQPIKKEDYKIFSTQPSGTYNNTIIKSEYDDTINDDSNQGVMPAYGGSKMGYGKNPRDLFSTFTEQLSNGVVMKTYECKECGRTTNRNSDIHKHIKTKHRI
jgi:hypothetical protein